MSLAQSLTVIIYVASRLPQIVLNFRNKNTGQLSLVTSAMNVAGPAIRVYTAIESAGGITVILLSLMSSLVPAVTLTLLGALASLTVNAIVLLQVIVFTYRPCAGVYGAYGAYGAYKSYEAHRKL